MDSSKNLVNPRHPLYANTGQMENEQSIEIIPSGILYDCLCWVCLGHNFAMIELGCEKLSIRKKEREISNALSNHAFTNVKYRELRLQYMD